MTPRELYRAFAADRQRREAQLERDVTLAWHVANLSKAEKLPSLRVMVERLRAQSARAVADRESQRLTHLAALHELSAKYGIPMRTVRLVRKPASGAAGPARKAASRGR